MGKLIVYSILIIIIALIAGMYPAVAVGVTAIVIVGLFLIFGNNY